MSSPPPPGILHQQCYLGTIQALWATQLAVWETNLWPRYTRMLGLGTDVINSNIFAFPSWPVQMFKTFGPICTRGTVTVNTEGSVDLIHFALKLSNAA